jgi:hypothetical protein
VNTLNGMDAILTNRWSASNGSLTAVSASTTGDVSGGGDLNGSEVGCHEPTLIRVHPSVSGVNGTTTIRIAAEANGGWGGGGGEAKCLRATGKDDMLHKQPVRKGTLR